MIWIVLACSGPGAMKAIERNERVGWLLFGITVGIAVVTATVVLLKRRPTRWMYAMIATAVLHPGLWMGARSGDCGGMLYISAFVGMSVTGVLALIALIAALHPRNLP